MTDAWSFDELDRMGRAEELQIASKRGDGTLRRWVPIWVVRVGDQLYLRTWYGRDTRWFAHVLVSRRARVRVPGLEVDVAVEQVGDGNADLHTSVDAAYRDKYGAYGDTTVDRMTTPDAAATTLRISPDQAPRPKAGEG